MALLQVAEIKMVLAASDGSELVQDAHRKAFALNPFMAVVIARFPGCRRYAVDVRNGNATFPIGVNCDGLVLRDCTVDSDLKEPATPNEIVIWRKLLGIALAATTPSATPAASTKQSAASIDVPVGGDATNCMEGPICSGPGDWPAGSLCPVKRRYRAGLQLHHLEHVRGSSGCRVHDDQDCCVFGVPQCYEFVRRAISSTERVFVTPFSFSSKRLDRVHNGIDFGQC
uniref:Uncharacterized protein n=1 Tax=Phytophthora ramorum TaxID=164328 RepID=H3H1D3_PHYRM